MPQFRTKKKGRAGEGQVYPLDQGSDIKSGPFPKGSAPLKKNVSEVKVPTNKPSKPAKKGSEAVPSASDPAPDMCTQAETVLKGNANDD